MTREEINNELDRAFEVLVHCGHMDMRRREAFYMASAALSAEPCGDCISRQAAIDTIENWLSCGAYNEAERHIMRAMLIELYDLPSITPKVAECEDCISREAVLDSLHVEGRPTKRFDYVIDVRRDIMALPPVTPKQKVGHWVLDHTVLDVIYEYHCSVCGHKHELGGRNIKQDQAEGYSLFCNGCGAKMEVK